MKEPYDIDKMFRDQLYDRKVEYDPSAWTEAEKIISDEENKRFFLYRFRYYLSALLIALISSFVYFSESKIESNENSINRTNNVKTSQISATAESKLTTEAVGERSNQKSSETDRVDNPFELSIKPIKKPVVQQKQFATFEKKPAPSDNALNMTVQNVSFTNGSTQESEYRKNIITNYLSSNRKDQEQNNLIVSTNLEFMIPLSLETSLEENQLREESHDPIEVYGKQNKFQGFKILGGLGMTNKYQNESTTAGYDPSYFIGIGYERSVSSKISIEMDILFSQRNALGGSLSSSDLNYDFGYNLEEIQYDFEKLQYLEIPLMIKYNISSIHQIGIGVQYAYLVQSKVKISDSKESTIDPNQTSTEYKWVKTDYFNSSEFSLVLGYDYTINERFKTGLRYQFGLSDMTSDVLSTIDHRNNQFRLVIQYKLWK